MKPNITVYGVLFVVGLLMAYYASQDSGEPAPSGQRWLNLRAADLHTIKYQEDGRLSLLIDRYQPGLFWAVHQQEGKDSTEFKVRSHITELAHSWAKLRALRVVGSAENIDLSEYELDDDKQKLSLLFGDQELAFIIGRRGFQSQENFVLDKQRNQVILISRQDIQPFQNALNELYERDIVTVEMDTIEQITLESESKQIVFRNQGNSSGSDIKWVADAESGADEELASAWLNRVLRLQIRTYESLNEADEIDQWPQAFGLKLSRNGRVVEELTLRSTPDHEETGSSYRLKTIHTHGYVRLYDSRVETILADLEAILQ